MNPDRLRQIAILVDSLDTAQADRLLEQLPEAAQQQVRNAVFHLSNIDEQERQAIIQDFVNRKKEDSPASRNSRPDRSPGNAAASGTYGDPRSLAARAYSSAATASLNTENGQSVPEYQKYLNRKDSSNRSEPTYSRERNSTETFAPPVQRQLLDPTGAEPDLVDALSQADIETLAAVVLKETPQVLAVVLSMLPADKSTRLLELFPATQRLDALRRLSQLEEIDEQVLDYLQQQLNRVVRRRVKLKGNQRSGPQALAAILSAAHRLHSSEVVNSIHQQFQSSEPIAAPSIKPSAFPSTSSPELEPTRQRPMRRSEPLANHHVDLAEASVASQLLNRVGNASQTSVTENSVNRQAIENVTKSQLPESQDVDQRLLSPEVNQVDAFSDAEIRFDFPRLANCDRSSLESLLATAKPKLTLLALRGASPKLLTRVLKLLPATEAKEVEYRIQNLGPTRLQDIQQAQTYMLRLASVLEDMGKFRRPRKSLLSF